MLAAQRRDVLLSRLATDGRIVVKDLAVELGVAEDSLRRDLRELAAAGLCQRVYGGALSGWPPLSHPPPRPDVAGGRKSPGGERGAALVAPGSTVILDGGTTTLEVARQLHPALEATVVTHSPTVAAALVEHPAVEVFLIGGRIFKHSAVASGAAAVEAASLVNADLFL